MRNSVRSKPTLQRRKILPFLVGEPGVARESRRTRTRKSSSRRSLVSKYLSARTLPVQTSSSRRKRTRRRRNICRRIYLTHTQVLHSTKPALRTRLVPIGTRKRCTSEQSCRESPRSRVPLSIRSKGCFNFPKCNDSIILHESRPDLGLLEAVDN